MKKNNEVIMRTLGKTRQQYVAEVTFNYGSPLSFPYAKGYYLTLTPCTTIIDEGGRAEVSKELEFSAKQLLFEIGEPSENAYDVALKSADTYMDTLVLQIEQNKIDKRRMENKRREEINDLMREANDLTNEIRGELEGLSRRKEEEENMQNNKNEFRKKENLNGIEKCKYYQPPSKVTFDDIAGMREVKREALEAISLFRDREKYEKMGVTSKMNNILLSGSPGSGKTYLVKAISNELDLPLFQSSGEFTDKYVGQGAKNVKTLFDEARRYAPSIIFIDEAEQVGRRRTGESNNSERESATSELLNQLDGFGTTDNVMVILATNLPDTLDDALMRRMTKKIHITNPDFETRLGILEINAKNKPMDENCDLTKIARNLSGFNGGTIANIMNQAGILAVRKGLEEITQTELEEAFEREVAGLKSETKKVSEKEKAIISHHEVGHAILTYLLKDEVIQKISIVPTTGSTLGYVMYANENENDKFLSTREDMLNSITVSLGGRASEELIFGEVTGGCSNDLEKATHMAETMVTRLGMSENFGLMSIDSKDLFMREKVLNEVNDILNSCYTKARRILEENENKLREIAKVLIDKEEMVLSDFLEVWNRE